MPVESIPTKRITASTHPAMRNVLPAVNYKSCPVTMERTREAKTKRGLFDIEIGSVEQEKTLRSERQPVV